MTSRYVLMVAAAGVVAAGVVPVYAAQASPSAPSPAASKAAPECTNAMVKAAYKGGDGATSHLYGRIVLTNVSSSSCFIRGYGGLSYVGKGNGTQIGAAADRDTGTKVTTIVLQPGAKVKSKVAETSFGAYDKSECKPTKVDGFRVYIPDSTKSQFIKHPTTGCAKTGVHLLSHQAYRKP